MVTPMSAEQDAASQPDRIGPYRILETLGEGGMGIVYLAEQTHPIRRRVALKLIKLGMDSKAVLTRFDAERQALALMEHENIAKVLDAGLAENGRPYFAMEYVNGPSLTQYCAEQHLGLRDRLELFRQICVGVQHAHQKGVIHRDLKPANVVLAPDREHGEVPKVIDFGLAKLAQTAATGGLTRTGQIVGTPLYMAPEQIFGQDIDNRADLYAVACTIYEMLTGRPPFIEGDVLYHHVHTPPPPVRQWAPELPVELDGILGKCLEKKKEARLASADALRQALRPRLQRYS